MSRWTRTPVDVPGLPPYPETVAPVGISEFFAFVILAVTLVAAVAVVLTVLRSSQRRNNTDARAVRVQTAIAAGVTVGVIMALNAVVVGAINGVAVDTARQTNFNNIIAYNRQYAAALREVYGIDVDADDANTLLAGAELQTELPDGESVSVVLVDEFEPELGLMDAATEEPIPPLTG
ncbi:hypothetical protein BH10ACT7_BH10ACT7_25320 [soil metagenome]